MSSGHSALHCLLYLSSLSPYQTHLMIFHRPRPRGSDSIVGCWLRNHIRVGMEPTRRPSDHWNIKCQFIGQESVRLQERIRFDVSTNSRIIVSEVVVTEPGFRIEVLPGGISGYVEKVPLALPMASVRDGPHKLQSRAEGEQLRLMVRLEGELQQPRRARGSPLQLHRRCVVAPVHLPA